VLRALGLGFDASLQRPVAPAGQQRVESLIRRRIRERIPAAYLLNEAWLEGRSFYVDRRVIVPRSHIAHLLSEKLRPWMTRPPRRILDLCTGSGCLAILAALAFPRARVVAADISPAALEVAAKNVGRYGLQRRIALVRSDLFARLPGERYDLIVTNPPYVPARSMRRLPPEYRYEPRVALAGGGGGLQFVSRILRQAPRHLAAGGLLVCELGANRRALERAYPGLPLFWPQDEVFILEAARTGAASRTAPRPAAAR
jgi:ribosomal protein L3 glutamine methyltransferase